MLRAMEPLVVRDGLKASYAEAGAECAAHSMRLCSSAELDELCCQTGCNMDGVLVWTSDDCSRKGTLSANETLRHKRWKASFGRAHVVDTVDSGFDWNLTSYIPPKQLPSSLQRIPRAVYQTYKMPHAQIPKGMRRAMASFQRLSPEYSHTYFDDAACTAYVAAEGHRFPGLQKAYEVMLSGAGRADLFRALLIWVEGGVYADADIILQIPLSRILRPADEGLTSYDPHMERGMLQMVLAFMPRHPMVSRLLMRAIETTLECYRSSDAMDCNPVDASGPAAVKRAIYEELGEVHHGNNRLTLNATHWTADRKAHVRMLDRRMVVGIPGAPRDNTVFRLKYDEYKAEAQKAGDPPQGWMSYKKLTTGHH